MSGRMFLLTQKIIDMVCMAVKVWHAMLQIELSIMLIITHYTTAVLSSSWLKCSNNNIAIIRTLLADQKY